MREIQNRPSPLGIGLSDRPKVSVLLTSTGDGGRLVEWLKEHVAECEAAEAQVVVLRAGDAAEMAELIGRYPAVLFLTLAADAPVAALRREGVQAAAGDIIVVQSADNPSREFLPQRLFTSRAAESVNTPH